MGEESCPELCLCLEVNCCFASSVMSTRFMLQHEMQIGNSQCDENLICLVAACEWTACIVSCVDESLGHAVQQLADGVYVSVCSCMQTQHALQLDARDSGTVPTFQTNVVMMAPPAQQMVAMPAHPGVPGQPHGAVMYAPQPGSYGQQQHPVYGYAAPQQPGGQMYYAPQPGGAGPAYANPNPMYAPPPPQYGPKY